MFSVGVGLCQGCALLPILFVIFMDRILRRSRGEESVGYGCLCIAFLLLADDVVQLASSDCDLQSALRWSAAECEAAGDEDHHLQVCRRTVDCSFGVGSESLPQVKDFKYTEDCV